MSSTDATDHTGASHVMPPTLPVEPSARTYTLADLMLQVRAGRVRVPHFQRGLRWTTPDAVALIDSVLRGFPIGSLLLWKRRASAQEFELGQVQVSAPRSTKRSTSSMASSELPHSSTLLIPRPGFAVHLLWSTTSKRGHFKYALAALTNTTPSPYRPSLT